MHNKIINIIRIFFVLILVTLGVLVFLRPANTETNILKAVFSSTEDNILVDLSSKFSARVNVIVENESPEKSEEIAKTIYAKLDKNAFYTSDVNIAGVLSDYEKHHNNLLSAQMRRLLINKQYDVVEEKGLEALYNPIMPPIGSIEEDPFLLLTDFVMELSDNKEVSNFTPIEFNEKYYSLIMLNVDSEIALSPSVLNEEVEKLTSIQKEFSKDGTNVYLSGAPVHSYFASSHSIFEINLISILSIIFIICLVYFYFGSIIPLIPIAVSIGAGIFAGWSMVSLIFKDIHILTFVFSTTLIGICVDYSLHYFVSLRNNKSGKDALNEIFKSLSVSLLTTVGAFVVLLFANFILLKQISVFTITGLVTVYSIVVLFYPAVFNKIAGQDDRRSWQLNSIIAGFVSALKKIKPPIKFIITALVCIVFIFSYSRISFDDNIKNMYVPPKFLVNAEKLFAQLAGTDSNFSFLVVKGQNLEDILEKEEAISDKLENENITYQSLSRYVPSVKRQKSNMYLRKQLYKDKMDEYAVFLPASQRIKLIKEKNDRGFLTLNNNFDLLKKNFLIDKNTSIMVLYDYDGEAIDGARVISLQKDISSQLRKCRIICLSLLLPIFVFLYLLLAKIYDFKSALKIISPSICAVLFVFAVLGLFNCPVNLFHLLAIFLIIGFGLDYSVFRFGGNKKSADAVLMSCMTTVFSFALLGFAGFKLISSLGIVLSLGLVSSYIFSVILIGKAGGQEDSILKIGR